jgi:hypothetical protein
MTGLLLASWLVASCIYIPMPHWAAKSRHNVTGATASELQVGVTTLEDVLLKLGEPDSVLDDGLRLGYQWTRVDGILVVGAMYVGATAEVTRTSTLELTFDKQGRLAHFEVVSKQLHVD